MTREARRALSEVRALERERELLRAHHDSVRLKMIAAQQRKLAALDRKIARAVKRARAAGAIAGVRAPRSAAVQAGPAAVAKVLAQIERGALSQREITRKSKLNPGTVSYALRALVEDGSILDAGFDAQGSRRFRLARRARKAA